MYLWPWSALYKAVISCPRHLTLGQASDEYTDGPCIIRLISFPIDHQPKRNEFSYLWLCTKAECVSTDGRTGQEHACLFTATGGTSRIEIRDVAISYTKRSVPSFTCLLIPETLLLENDRIAVDARPPPRDRLRKVILSGDVRQLRQFIRFSGKFSGQSPCSMDKSTTEQDICMHIAGPTEHGTRVRVSVFRSAQQKQRLLPIGLPLSCGQGINPRRASSRLRRRNCNLCFVSCRAPVYSTGGGTIIV